MKYEGGNKFRGIEGNWKSQGDGKRIHIRHNKNGKISKKDLKKQQIKLLGVKERK